MLRIYILKIFFKFLKKNFKIEVRQKVYLSRFDKHILNKIKDISATALTAIYGSPIQFLNTAFAKNISKFGIPISYFILPQAWAWKSKRVEIVKKYFDLRPAAIIKQFDLQNLPKQRGGCFYRETAAYGHFGRNDLNLPWENVTDQANELRKTIHDFA